MAVYSDGLAKLRENLEWFLQSGVDTSIIGKTKEPVSIEKPKGIVARPEKIYVPEDNDVDEDTIGKQLKERALDNWGKIFAESQAAAMSSASTKKDKKPEVVIVDETMDNSKERSVDVSKNLNPDTSLVDAYLRKTDPKKQGSVKRSLDAIAQRELEADYLASDLPRTGSTADIAREKFKKGMSELSKMKQLKEVLPKKESLVKKPLATLDSDIPEGRGINERATDPVYEVQSSVFTDEVLGPNEGVVAGDITTGKTDKESLPYGIVDDKGVKREDYIEGPKGDKTFAAAVVEIHYKELDEKFQKGGHNLKSMPKDVQYAFLDLHWNYGSVGNDTVTYFDPKNMTKSLNNTLEFLGTTRKNNEQIALPSISDRRIAMYNKAAKATGKPKIQYADMTKSGSGTLVVYRDVHQKEIHSFTHPYKLANVSNSGATIERQSATWSAENNNNTWSYE